MRRKVLVATGVVTAAFLLVAGAQAAKTTVKDGNDANGPLDIEVVKRSGAGKRPVFKIVTRSTFTPDQISQTGHLLINFDTRQDERTDYYAMVLTNHHRLVGHFFKDRNPKRDVKLRNFGVWRKNKRSVSFRIPLSWMKFGGKRFTYGWEAQTLFNGSSKCSKVCFDFAPDAGYQLEPIPGRTEPEPEPTPT